VGAKPTPHLAEMRGSVTGSGQKTQSRDGHHEARVQVCGKARRRPPLAEAAALCLGMILFGLFSHQGLPWITVGAAGLLAAAFCIQRSILSMRDIPPLFGLSGSRKALILSLGGCAVGVGLGAYYRFSFEMPLLPGPALQPFALAACAIGAAEELVYRGWMQGRLRVLGWPAAVLVSAAAHTAYKTALFALPPSPVNVYFPSLIVLTFIVGALFGLSRELSRSIYPAVAAHVAFDLMVYGAAAQAPWWVWT
jgi:membrane protease YdiL (CAAX protease family)